MTTTPSDVIYTGQFTSFSREQIVEAVGNTISERRMKHVLGVEKTAVELAVIYNESSEKASIAALTHDIAKERPDEEMRDLIISENLDLDLLQYGNNVWHGPAAANIVQSQFGITDEDILNAVTHHTVGSQEMSLLEKIIYVADYIEPGRSFPGVEEAREMAYTDLDEAVSYETEKTLQHLIKNKIKIYPKAIETYNKWVANNQ